MGSSCSADTHVDTKAQQAHPIRAEKPAVPKSVTSYHVQGEVTPPPASRTMSVKIVAAKPKSPPDEANADETVVAKPNLAAQTVIPKSGSISKPLPADTMPPQPRKPITTSETKSAADEKPAKSDVAVDDTRKPIAADAHHQESLVAAEKRQSTKQPKLQCPAECITPAADYMNKPVNEGWEPMVGVEKMPGYYAWSGSYETAWTGDKWTKASTFHIKTIWGWSSEPLQHVIVRHEEYDASTKMPLKLPVFEVHMATPPVDELEEPVFPDKDHRQLKPMSYQQLPVGSVARLIVEYGLKMLGRKDGNGECWTVCANALEHVPQCLPCRGTVFGRMIPWNETMPGDILFFELVSIVTPQYTASLGTPLHFAIVQDTHADGSVTMLHQNVTEDQTVQQQSYNFSYVTDGKIIVYRPQPKP
eukprot:TRINITY_DN1025_c0_g1_i1.p1 TRINITY_DN1025_c0_g1~~TRINITY_DN1025_c0_g1_i1.p1  ORF type:complete len:418 (-),score=78.86 TRINITY_DN1025_c0_g1_i1:34-1287(-)